MGFLGFGNYSKPGKGVKKNEAEKKRIFEFFDLLSRKFTKLIQLNLLYILFCLPAVAIAWGGVYIAGITIEGNSAFLFVSSLIIAAAIATTGPATAGLLKICRYYTEEKPVFLWSDYVKTIKDNFGQSLLMSTINAVLMLVIYHSFTFYYGKAAFESMFYWIPLALILMIAIIFMFASFYTFLIIVSVDLPFRQVIKNSVSFAFLGLKTNFLTGFFAVVIVVLSLMFYPISLLVVFIIALSLLGLIVAFNSFQYIYRFSIRPYYVMNNLPNPYEPEEINESIFEDATK